MEEEPGDRALAHLTIFSHISRRVSLDLDCVRESARLLCSSAWDAGFAFVLATMILLAAT